jgi:epsilon-lactone hydrolase
MMAGAYRNFVGHIAARTRAAAFIPNYRLAPEHPLPAAIDDTRFVYDGLVEAGWRRIGVAGDSAGGTLAIELLASLVQRHAAVVPAAGVLLSPVTNLTLSGETWVSRDQADLIFTKDQAQEVTALYLAGADAASALASPPADDDAGDDDAIELLGASRFLAQALAKAERLGRNVGRRGR